MEIHFIDNPRENVPFGSAGCAEMFQTSGHVAIINGIFNACGVRVYELPALPEKIKAGLGAIASGRAAGPPGPYFLGSDFFEEVRAIASNPVENEAP